ncbi:MAG: hypothetical protein FWH28_06105 [Clostridiales bacterium]|nr:hypothetical protein [Clostridiales bacterium]
MWRKNLNKMLAWIVCLAMVLSTCLGALPQAYAEGVSGSGSIENAGASDPDGAGDFGDGDLDEEVEEALDGMAESEPIDEAEGEGLVRAPASIISVRGDGEKTPELQELEAQLEAVGYSVKEGKLTNTSADMAYRISDDPEDWGGNNWLPCDEDETEDITFAPGFLQIRLSGKLRTV